jgi:hypothetical protein
VWVNPLDTFNEHGKEHVGKQGLKEGFFMIPDDAPSDASSVKVSVNDRSCLLQDTKHAQYRSGTTSLRSAICSMFGGIMAEIA